MSKKNLLLGSSSQSRQILLNAAKIPFTIVGHTADEDSVVDQITLQDTVLAIAKLKMEHVAIPENTPTNQALFILTADTMGTNAQGVTHGKPTDRNDAIEKIKSCRNGVLTVATAFCIEKREYVVGSGEHSKGVWVVQSTHSQVVTATCTFEVPDAWIDRYIDNSMALIASGAVATEGYGTQFVKVVNGSFSTINGLPMFELREALEKFGFFD